MIRKALLDDWGAVKEAWGRLARSRFAARVPASLQDIERYFANALTNPQIAFPILEVGENVKGFAIVHDAISLDLQEGPGSLGPNKVAFLRILHLEPVEKRYSDEMNEWLNVWARARGATMLQGYCCLDFPLEAYRRLHDIRPLWYVVGKEVH